MKYLLYDELSELDKDIEIDDKLICRTIVGLEKKHSLIIYSLIIHHYYVTEGKNPSNIPYSGKTLAGNKGINIIWSKLPSDLKIILAHYIDNCKSA
jgi:hypothetical protein